jgi:predicted enzyme related to lactoylglutathione lyase
MRSAEEDAGWGSVISVDDIDDVTSRARALGADVLVDPYDVEDAGRNARLRDAAGATVSLWQARNHIGAGLVNEVATWTWNELVAADLDAAASFYGDLFGWSTQEAPGPLRRMSFMLGESCSSGRARAESR